MNVEFFYSSMGERRLGCETVDISGSLLDSQTETVHLSEWFPTNDAQESYVWAMTAVPGVSVKIAYRDLTGTWNPVTPRDAVSPLSPMIFNVIAQPFNAKDFFAYQSPVDLLHVWDGSTLRRVGLPAPPPVTAVNYGMPTPPMTLTRYYRVRIIRKVGTQIVLRSEPSTVLTFVPSGSQDSAQLTMPTPPDGSETHWEIEASFDNANFYRVQTQALNVLTYIDGVQDTETYSAEGPLSEAVGAYLLFPSGKFLLIDGDRLIVAGHWTNPDLQSRVMWSPSSNDPGVGNDERLPIVTTGGLPIASFKDLNNYDGGGLTGMSRTVNGTFYVFKWSAIYQMTRTNDVTNAYTVIQLSSNAGPRGAIEGSIVPGTDEYGQPCIYFLDPFLGPSRIGNMGMERIEGQRTTWKSVNTTADLVTARSVYYPDKQQIIWWVAYQGSNTPTLCLKLQTTELQDQSGFAGRGWSQADGLIAKATAVSQVTEVVSLNGNPQMSRRPYIGLSTPLFLQRCDTGDTDSGANYTAEILTRPYIVAGIMNQWEVMAGALLADINANASVQVQVIRDYGVETKAPIVTALAPVGGETQVIRQFDDLNMAEAYAIQFRFSDVGA
jgi:hypothetical protein